MFDSGVRATHSEFAGRIGAGPPGTDHNDCSGHGTGVAKKAIVHPVRVLGCDGAGSAANVLTAIDWVTGSAPRPAVVNMSWGTGPQDTLDNAIRASIAAGVTYVVAAGNDNSGSCAGSPERISEAIVVGAVDDKDRRASFSNPDPAERGCSDSSCPSWRTRKWVSSTTMVTTLPA